MVHEMRTALRILVIEDSEDDAILVLHQIKKAGYDVDYERVDTAKQMRAALAERTWDLVLSDYKMPHFDGLEALTILKESAIDIPFIVISGTIGEEVAVEMMIAGAHDYLMKNNLKRLIPAITRELLESKNRARRKHAELALKEQYSTLRGIIENTDALIFSLDRQYKYTSFNSGHAAVMKEIYGAEIETGHSLLDYMTVVEDRDTAKHNLDRVLAGEQITEEAFSGEELRSRRYFQISHTPIRTEEGTIIGIAVFAVDITERKHVEKSILSASLYSRSLIEASLDPLVTISPDGKITDVNQATELVTGIPRDHLIGTDFSDYFTEQEKARAGYQQVMVQGLLRDYPLTIRHTSGSTTDVLYNASVYKNQEGEIQGVFAAARDITERKKAQEKIVRLAAIVESSEDAIIGKDLNGNIISWNKGAEKIYGYRESDVIGKSISILIPPGFSNDMEHILEKIKSGMHIENYATKRLRQDGQEIHVSLTVSPIRDTEGRIIAVSTIGRDITQRKKNEEKILKLNRIYAVLSNINEAIVRVREAGKILNEACRIAVEDGGFTMAWIGMINIAKHKVDVVASHGVSGDYLKNINIDLNDEIRSGGPCGSAIKTRTHKISNDISKDVSMSPWWNEANEYGYKSVAAFPLIVFDKVIGTFNIYYSETDFFKEDDIALLDEMTGYISFALEFIETDTRRKQVEEGLEEYKLATEQSPASIVITDINGNIEYVNPKFTEISGYTFAELKGQNPRILKSGEMSSQEYKALWDTILNGEEWRGELHNKRKDGTLYWESAVISSIKNSNKGITHFIAIKEDITEQKLMELDLRVAKENAEEMSRLKSSLLLNMSHEIRTPMNGILGFAGLLKEQPLDDESLKMVDIISNSGRRLMTTLNSILDLAQVEAGKQNLQITPVHLSEMICNLQMPYIELAENKKLKFISTVEDNICSLLDERLLQNMLHHLLDNAIKFTASGTISLILKKEVLQGTPYATILVKDSGIGIPSEKMDLIFEAFRQGSEGMGRSFEGTGLGLTLCKKFVELLNGTITVESVPEIGSTFTVRFPLYYPTPDELMLKPLESNTPEVEEIPEVSKKKKKAKVLIVEDNEPNCELMEIYLRSYCDSDSVFSGKQAVKHAFINQYDLILMDINLGPDMDGIQATKEIRSLENYKNIPIIAVTGFSTIEEKTKILSSGIDQLLSKPFTRDELLKMVRSVV